MVNIFIIRNKQKKTMKIYSNTVKNTSSKYTFKQQHLSNMPPKTSGKAAAKSGKAAKAVTKGDKKKKKGKRKESYAIYIYKVKFTFVILRRALFTLFFRC